MMAKKYNSSYEKAQLVDSHWSNTAVQYRGYLTMQLDREMLLECAPDHRSCPGLHQCPSSDPSGSYLHRKHGADGSPEHMRKKHVRECCIGARGYMRSSFQRLPKATQASLPPLVNSDTLNQCKTRGYGPLCLVPCSGLQCWGLSPCRCHWPCSRRNS
jgi:hypothetical protein